MKKKDGEKEGGMGDERHAQKRRVRREHMQTDGQRDTQKNHDTNGVM